MTSLQHLENLQAITSTIIEESENIFASLEEEIINHNLEPSSWSIAQCLNHLNTYSEFYHKQFKEVLDSEEKESLAENTDEIKYSWLGKKFLKYIELDENDQPKKKMKAPKKSFQVNSDFTKKEVRKFIDNQKELWAILETAKEKNSFRFKKIHTMFPLVKLKSIEMLAITVHHNYRHFVQAKKVLQKIKIQSN